MITGSFASSIQGEMRLSHDIDLVVALKPDGVKALLRAFPPPAYYLSEESIREAMRTKKMFNLLVAETNDKVDFWMLKDTPFDRSCFARKYPEDFEDIWLQISMPEDTILAKLRWAKECGGSEKQMADVLGVYKVKYKKLDLAYISRWVHALGIEDLWAEIQKQAEVP